MSLIPLEASTANGNTVLTSAEGWSLHLSPLNARKIQNATSRKRSCSARAIRPSGCTRVRFPMPSRPRPIRSSPPETSPSRKAFLSGAIVNISVLPNVAVAPDQQIWLEFDQERMHLFDGATEMAVKAD